MSLQARMTKDDNRLYSPNRDLAHNFNQIVQEVARRCETGNWADLHRIAAAHGATDEEIGQACCCLCVFVLGQLDHKEESMSQALDRSGFLALKPASRMVVMAYLGSVVLGIHWVGVREATLGGVGPLLSCEELRERGKQCAILLGMPRWRRPLYKLGRRLKRAWQALRGQKTTEE